MYSFETEGEWSDRIAGISSQPRFQRSMLGLKKRKVSFMSEVWRFIPGFEGRYEVSSRGSVRSLDVIDAQGRKWPGRMFKGYTSELGYVFVALRKDGKPKSFSVHRLVALAFLGPATEEKPYVLHSDGNPGNNNLENLRWGSQKENIQDAIKHGTFKNPMVNLTHCKRGHLFEDGSYYQTSQGSRQCKRCTKDRSSERYYRLKEVNGV